MGTLTCCRTPSPGRATEGRGGSERSVLITKLYTNVLISMACFIKRHAYIYIYINKHMRQVHKYWDIDTILIFVALYHTTMKRTSCALTVDLKL